MGPNSSSDRKIKSGALALGGLAAILASACCLGPLIFVSIGLGGAWLSSLTALEPARPVFLLAAFAALGYAGYRIFRRSPQVCAPGEICALPETQRIYKIIFWIAVALVIIAIGFPYVAPFFY